MNIRELLGHRRLWCDGGFGTLLQSTGLAPGEAPEAWNLSHPEAITAIHAAYIEAGANLITANTFGANSLHFDKVEEIISAALANARRAVEVSGREDVFVSYDIGPLGKLLKPLGDLSFEDAVSIFARGVRAAAAAGADLILIETMNDAYETKAAVLAAKENSDLPILVTNAYDKTGKLITGADPVAMVALLEGLGVDALGINCSQGPAQMLPVIETLLQYASVPVMVNPNAGLPSVADGRTVFDVSAEEFAETMEQIARMGASILGGCCGTTPEYIRRTVERTSSLPYLPPVKKNHTLVSSYTHAVTIGGGEPVLIGERINPTGKKRFKEALRQGDMDYILGEGIAQEEKGAHILDVNVGLPEIDETAMMCRVITELQALTALPLQLDTVDPVAMEAALRIYNGKPLINSVNGKEESLSAILPLAKKYGGVLIALTLDENGIPETAEGRVAIAKKIIDRAEAYGIDRKNILVDPLAMTVSSDNMGGVVTLQAIDQIGRELGVGTSLGVSNISFGLPCRDTVNGTFFAMALERGLSAAIMNPHSAEMMKTYFAFRALRGLDDNCTDYMDFAATLPSPAAVGAAVSPIASADKGESLSPLQYAIVKGMQEAAYTEAKALLAEAEATAVIEGEIVPALDHVGRDFEAGKTYLPRLLMSAEAAKSAFEAVKERMGEGSADGRKKVILATVKGDIHDIGKNIVKVLLANYGYTVLDLGKDVPPEAVCRTVLEEKVSLVGLSALMTTTVPAMEETIRQLHACAPHVKVFVGGAVLTEEYASMIHADRYCKDAMASVRYAEEFFDNRFSTENS